MKILLLGGSGLLGTELKKLNPDLITPDHGVVDIAQDLHSQLDYVPDVVIHAAAITDNRAVEKNPSEALATNISGSVNVALYCIRHNIRLVYISTDYVYPGDRGNYLETDPVMPFNLYAWTKLGGECAVKAVKNHLIIRTSFGGQFKYSQAFIDKWTSKDYVNIIALMILEAALSPLTGVLNLGTERKTLYQHAWLTSGTVKPISLRDSNFFSPYDTSLNLQKWEDYKSSNPIAKPHTVCRCCGSTNLEKYLDLGLMPLANNLEFTAQRAKDKERFPLQVLFCQDCGLSQLSVVVDPDKMFSYYTYRSSVNAGYVKHCYEMAAKLRTWQYSDEIFHIDIAGNDGALLQAFKKFNEDGSGSYKVLNIDPATNLTAIAEANGIPSRTEFWSPRLAEEYAEQADLITATNVFAHVDNIRDFLYAAKIALKQTGVLVLEFPYLPNFIENMEFDTVYFEHLSYMSLNPIIKLCSEVGMHVKEVEEVDIHGGSLRVIIGLTPGQDSSVQQVRGSELLRGYSQLETYQSWGGQVAATVKEFGDNLLKLKKSGAKIAAFAASAKGNTLLNCAGMNTDIIDFIADETPEKIGKFSPGTGIPIVNKVEIQRQKPDFIVILSWNFADEIIAKIRDLGFEGTFIMPIPKFQML